MIAGAIDQVVRNATHLLLDFDGPVCSVFSGMPNHVVAEDLRAQLKTAGVVVPGEVQNVGDPLKVFRTVAELNDQAAETAQRILTNLETDAVRTARPTDGATELIATARATGRTVTVVSNNSGVAIAAYLGSHELAGDITAIVGRDDCDPAHLKPSPYLVLKALRQLDAQPSDCALVGDSPSDITAGHQASVAVIGFANKPGKHDRLAHAGAEAVTTRLADISTALRTTT